ncbi:zinc knuckle CX2CX4HX4C containing protein [Tanacetum coccineum]|uniref:Zinc knuckle CX2CX4HX4C containing protein n=1 Tax=Tanacetum coccineum TaxID=301880 RepID=A0ABQ5CAH0_9ASTR
MVRDSSNILHEGKAGAFVNHYENFLGIEDSTTPLLNQYLFTHVLDHHKAEFMVKDVTDSEIKDAIFSMGYDKAPGPDGFTSAFFKKAWDIVGVDVTCVICDFFVNGKLLKEINHTIISLVPKVSTPAKINDYRPISCCNDIEQYFAYPRVNAYYHMRRGPPRCAFKVDIQKAYDTIDWAFLKSILIGFGFHHKMVDWIMTCVSTTSYSQRVYDYEGLEEFKNVSGLVSNIPKSTAFFCNVPNALKASILNSMPFEEGSLLVRGRWGWRELLQIHPLVCPFIWNKINNGKYTNIWFDKWHDLFPIRRMLTVRDITRSGFGLSDSVSDLLDNGNWRWPPDWLDRFSGLSFIPFPNLSVDDDVLLCRDLEGNLRPFSVWFQIRGLSGMDQIAPLFYDISAYLIPTSKGKSVASIISRLLLVAASYYIWIERNSRLFKKKASIVPQIVQVITSMVHLKLVSFKFKKVSGRSRMILDQWKIPSCCMVHEGSSG